MPEIRHAILIDASADRLRPLVASAAGLAAWWAEDVTQVADSSSVELGFFNRTTVYRLAPQPTTDDDVRWECESGEEWAGTILLFHLEPIDGGKTRLEFSHSNWASESPYFVSCNTVWGHLMFRLKDAAERGDAPRPLFTTTGMDSSAAQVY
jgi:hypothetical protein